MTQKRIRLLRKYAPLSLKVAMLLLVCTPRKKLRSGTGRLSIICYNFQKLVVWVRLVSTTLCLSQHGQIRQIRSTVLFALQITCPGLLFFIVEVYRTKTIQRPIIFFWRPFRYVLAAALLFISIVSVAHRGSSICGWRLFQIHTSVLQRWLVASPVIAPELLENSL